MIAVDTSAFVYNSIMTYSMAIEVNMKYNQIYTYIPVLTALRRNLITAYSGETKY